MGGGQPPQMGGPGAGMDAIAGLQQTPAPGKEKQAIADAKNAIGVALSGYAMRMPKAAKFLSEAMMKLNDAEKAASEEQPLGAPPMLGMESGMNPMAQPGGMGF